MCRLPGHGSKPGLARESQHWEIESSTAPRFMDTVPANPKVTVHAADGMPHFAPWHQEQLQSFQCKNLWQNAEPKMIVAGSQHPPAELRCVTHSTSPTTACTALTMDWRKLLPPEPMAVNSLR